MFVERARVLVGMGEIREARRDLEGRRAVDVEEEIARVTEPRYLPKQGDGSVVRDGVVIAPALSALGREALEGLVEEVEAVRRGEPVELGGGAAERMLAARIARDAGQPDGELLVGSEVWQARVEALEDGLDAPVAYGVVAELGGVELPAVRRARAAAARASRWEPVRATEASAGHESMVVMPGGIDEVPGEALRAALLAAPWEGQLVDPGEGVALAIDGPRTVRVEVWCRRLWPAEGPDACEAAIGIDQGAQVAREVAHGQVFVEEIAVPDGRHEIEVGLGEGDPTVVAAVRFSDERGPIDAARPVRAFLARPGRPMEIVVAGPGAVMLELRGYEAPHDVAEVTIGRRTIEMAIDPAPAPAVRGQPGRGVAVTAAVERVLRLEKGPNRIVVTPRRGTIAVRAAVRVRARAPVEPERGGVEEAPALVGRGAAPEPVARAVLERRARGPTVSGEAILGHDDLAPLDDDLESLGARAELGVEVRRRIAVGPVRPWVRGELRGRRLGEMAPTGVLRLAAEARYRGWVGAVDLRGAAQAGTVGGRSVVGVEHGRGIAREVVLVVGVQRTDTITRTDADNVDPVIATDYRRDHPAQQVYRAGVRWRPFADQLAAARLEIADNGAPWSIDRVGAELSCRGLVEILPLRGPIATIAYRPSVRIADDDRAETYLRNDAGLSLAYTFPAPGGRVTAALVGDVFVPSDGRAASSVRLVLRWDLDRRGGADFTPSELPLADYVLGRPWTTAP